MTSFFYDERLENIPFDEPTDLVAMTVETYTARRSYQIAGEFRRRDVPVVMGGYHPTFLPQEALQYADSVVTGDAENVWQQVVEDARSGNLRPLYSTGGSMTFPRFARLPISGDKFRYRYTIDIPRQLNRSPPDSPTY